MIAQYHSGAKMLGRFLGASLLLFQGIAWTNTLPTFAQSTETKPPECEDGICTRGPELDPNTPHIISPRNSFVLDDRPLLRWYQVEGATRYIVKIQGPNVQWEAQTSDPFLTYEAINFVPGEEYLLIVSTHDGQQEDKSTFVRLTAEAKQAVEGAIAALSEGLSPLEKVMRTVDIYEEEMLFNDAINVLETYLEEFGATKTIYDALMRLYGEVGLNQKVKFYQEQANNLQ